ncbi:stress response kinase A, partial [Aeromonas sp. CPF2-S1]|nr:stress response kinase A [Aeromonas sp. CPF2-S1]
RWEDPAFPRHFSWFNTEHYWRQQIATLHDQLEALKAPPLSLMPQW